MLRNHINDILDNKKSENTIIIENPNMYSLNEDLEEINNQSLLSFTIPFVNGHLTLDISFYEEYMDLIDHYKIIDKQIKNMRQFTKENRTWKRNDKIGKDYFINNFTKLNRDFDDREWILDLLKYFYLISIDEVMFLVNLKRIENPTGYKTSDVKKYDNILRIDESGKRENLLVERNKPTMSLDDYAMKIMAEMKKNEKETVVNNVESDSSFETSIMRKNDSLNDDGKRGSGNRKGFG